MRTPTCLLAALLLSAASAPASTFSVSGSGNSFTISRSGDTSAAERVYYRAVSRTAIAGAHFQPAEGYLDFAAGQLTNRVTVAERTAAQINNPLFVYYQYGGTVGSSRAYRFEVVDGGGFVLAAANRTISYDATKSVSLSTFDENALTVSSGEITVTDKGFTQAYHAVPCESYLSSLPQDYLAASDARIRMTLDFQAAEVSDGYQYLQIVTNTTTACDNANSADGGNPGTPSISCFLAGFEHEHGSKNANYKKYSFPVTSAGSNCGAVATPWSDLGNDIGNLCQQYFRSGTRAADGRIALLPSISSLGIRFDASGSDNDDWTAKSVVARLQAVPAAPSPVGNPVLSSAPVCKGSTVTVSLAFNQIMTVAGTPTLVTSWGNLAYVAGSGANVLTFSGTVTAAAGTSFRITGLNGTVGAFGGGAFAWSGTYSSGRTVDSLPVPPLEAATGFYLLSTPAHLRWFADRIASYPNTSAAIACDIDLSAAGSFSAIAATPSPASPSTPPTPPAPPPPATASSASSPPRASSPTSSSPAPPSPPPPAPPSSAPCADATSARSPSAPSPADSSPPAPTKAMAPAPPSAASAARTPAPSAPAASSARSRPAAPSSTTASRTTPSAASPA